MDDPRPITRLKPDDAPAADPQAVGIALMRLLDEIADESVSLQRLFTRWGDDPLAVMHKAQSRTLELREMALRAPELGQQLMQACRSAGVFSTRVGGD